MGLSLGNRIGIGKVQQGAGLSVPVSFNMVQEGHSFVSPGTLLDRKLNELVNISTYYNSAVSGSNISHLNSRAASVDAKIITESKTLKNILVVWSGTNDMTSNTDGMGTTAYNSFKTYVQNRLSAGWKVFAFTCTPATVAKRGDKFEAERTIFNNLLRNDLALLTGVKILNTDNVSELSNTSNTIYYSDGLHLTDLGAFIVSDLFKNSIGTVFTNMALQKIPATNLTSLTATSSGTGVAYTSLRLVVKERTVFSLDGSAKFYIDSSGNGETSLIALPPGSNWTVYIKCTSGTSNLNVEKDNVTNISIVACPTNAPIIGGNVSPLTALTILNFGGIANNFSGSISDLTNLVYLDVQGSNTLSGNIPAANLLEYFACLGNNTITGGLNNLTSAVLRHFNLRGQNTINDYTSGINFSDVMNYFCVLPVSPGGLSGTEVDNLLIDIDASSPWAGTSKTFYVSGINGATSSASAAAKLSLAAKGVNVVVN